MGKNAAKKSDSNFNEETARYDMKWRHRDYIMVGRSVVLGVDTSSLLGRRCV